MLRTAVCGYSRISALSFRSLTNAFPKIIRRLSISNHIDHHTDYKSKYRATRFYSHKAPLTIKSLEERIILVLSLYDKINPKVLTLDSDFFKDLGLDSLDHVELIMAIEDEFGFEIPDGFADNMKTPRDILQFICDKEDVYE